MSKCVKCGNEILTGDIHWEMGLCNNCYNELYKDHKTHISLDKMWLELAQDFRDENKKLQDKVSDLEAKLAESERLIFTCQNIFRQKPETATEMCEFLQPYERKLKLSELEIDKLKQQLAEKETEYNKLKQCFDKVSKNCTFDELREIIITGEENSNERVIKMLNEQVETLEQQLAKKDKEIEKITKIVAYRDDMDRSTTINGVKFTDEQIITLQNIDYFADKHNQDKISFAVAYLEIIKEFIIDKEFYFVGEDYSTVYVEDITEEIDNQIKQLKEGK